MDRTVELSFDMSPVLGEADSEVENVTTDRDVIRAMRQYFEDRPGDFLRLDQGAAVAPKCALVDHSAGMCAGSGR
jgi:hypothetical protein